VRSVEFISETLNSITENWSHAAENKIALYFDYMPNGGPKQTKIK
jgi:hypothetical protein